MTGAEALALAVARLRAAGVEDPQRDARRLLAHAMGTSVDRLTLSLRDSLDPGAAERFETCVAARESRRPVAQIIGRRDFWGREFLVTPDVLDPRADTETVVELALAEPFDRVLDLGTGSGAILLSLLAERPQARGLGTDVSDAALEVARTNARRLGVGERAEFRQADWFDGVEGDFDLIVSNPPYIAADEMAELAPEVRRWEPRGALTDGGDGLSAYRAIAAGAASHLCAGGRLIVETGWRQGPAVGTIFRAAGLEDVTCHPDLEGRHRAVTARKP